MLAAAAVNTTSYWLQGVMLCAQCSSVPTLVSAHNIIKSEKMMCMMMMLWLWCLLSYTWYCRYRTVSVFLRLKVSFLLLTKFGHQKSFHAHLYLTSTSLHDSREEVKRV